MKATRTERDAIGSLDVPVDAYYGIQARRAQINFPISGLRMPGEMVEGMALVKKAAALTNAALGRLSEEISGAVVRACDEVLAGQWRDQFIVDVFQMGAGTAFHMNCNEVLANRAGEILGDNKGSYTKVHPHDHVNLGQSTNDVFPTAMRIAFLSLLQKQFFPSLNEVTGALVKKSSEFDDVLKSGRTHLQDAAPIRLGQEFQAYASSLGGGELFLRQAARSLEELGIGGSAVGTGLNTTTEYAKTMVRTLSDHTGWPLRPSSDLRESMQSMRPFTEVSSALRNLAVETTRICNDLRLLSSGPRTGLGEIHLPPVAPGSSIMPGKVNPSIPEMVNMVCFQVIGCDTVIAAAAQAGQLELNVMMPVIAYNLCWMISLFSNALRQLGILCIRGINADRDRCLEYARTSLGIITALSPCLGYAKAAEIAREAAGSEKSIHELIREKKILTEDEMKRLLDPAWMTEPGSLGRGTKNNCP